MIGEITRKIKVQFNEPQVYSLLLSYMIPGNFGMAPTTILYMHICLAYSLDGALACSKQEAAKKHPETEAHAWVMQIHCSKTIKHIDEWLLEQELKIVGEPVDESLISEKNILMKKIINLKDKSLLEQHRESFTEKEIKYMETFFREYEL